MGYLFYIDRGRNPASGIRESPITLEEWRAAVEKRDGVRLATGPLERRLPDGSVLSVQDSGGDAEAWRGPFRGWKRVFRWRREGRVAFNPEAFVTWRWKTDIGLPLKLAEDLGARIVGESGEIYDSPIID